MFILPGSIGKKTWKLGLRQVWGSRGKDMCERKNYIPLMNIGINLYLEAHQKIYKADNLKTLSIKLQIWILISLYYIGLLQYSYEIIKVIL